MTQGEGWIRHFRDDGGFVRGGVGIGTIPPVAFIQLSNAQAPPPNLVSYTTIHFHSKGDALS